jgi:hypothetical protein
MASSVHTSLSKKNKVKNTRDTNGHSRMIDYLSEIRDQEEQESHRGDLAKVRLVFIFMITIITAMVIFVSIYRP